MRDKKGRFENGNPGGPGRPPRDTDLEYLLILAEGCPLDTWKDIVKRAVSDATAGNAKAREWLGSYLVGKPVTDAVPLTTMLGSSIHSRRIPVSPLGHSPICFLPVKRLVSRPIDRLVIEGVSKIQEFSIINSLLSGGNKRKDTKAAKDEKRERTREHAYSPALSS